jgi:WD40 repeat protein
VLITADQKGTCLLIDRQTKRPIFSVEQAQPVLHVASSSIASFLVQSRPSLVTMYDSTTTQPITRLETGSNSFCRCHQPQEGLLASGTANENELALWDLASAHQQPVVSFTHPAAGMLMDCKMISPLFLAGAYEDGALLVFDVRRPSSELVFAQLSIQPNKTVATSFDVFPDGGLLRGVGGGCSDELVVFKLDLSDSSSASKTVPGAHTPGRGKGVGQITIRGSDGAIAAVGSWDSRVRVVHARTGKHLAVLKHHKDSVNAVAFSPCGQWLCSGGKDCLVVEWGGLYTN